MAEHAPDHPFRFDLAAGVAATMLGLVSFWFFHTIWISATSDSTRRGRGSTPPIRTAVPW